MATAEQTIPASEDSPDASMILTKLSEISNQQRINRIIIDSDMVQDFRIGTLLFYLIRTQQIKKYEYVLSRLSFYEDTPYKTIEYCFPEIKLDKEIWDELYLNPKYPSVGIMSPFTTLLQQLLDNANNITFNANVKPDQPIQFIIRNSIYNISHANQLLIQRLVQNTPGFVFNIVNCTNDQLGDVLTVKNTDWWIVRNIKEFVESSYIKELLLQRMGLPNLTLLTESEWTHDIETEEEAYELLLNNLTTMSVFCKYYYVQSRVIRSISNGSG